MTSLASQKPFLLTLPPEILTQIISLIADSTDFRSVHSLLFSCKQLYVIALPFSVQTFCDVPRAEVPKEGTVVRSRVVQFLSYVSIIKPELARHVRTIRLYDWLTDSYRCGTVHNDANDTVFYKQQISKIYSESLGYLTFWRDQWIGHLEARIEEAAVDLLLAVCTEIRNLTYGYPRDPSCFSSTLVAATGAFRRRRVEHPPCQLLTKLENVKHEAEAIWEGRHSFYDHAQWLFRISSIRSYECVGACSPQMDEYALDPLKEGCSNIQSIILRDSWCVPRAIRSLIGACKDLRKFTYTCDIKKRTEYDDFETTARDIMEALLPHDNSLEYLHLDLMEETRTNSCLRGPRERLYMGVELRQMHKLKSLAVGSQNICGLLANGIVYHYTRDASIQPPRVVECIPEYLKHLEIYSCGRNIISQLEEFLDTLIYPDRFPELSSVKFSFNEEWVEKEGIKSLISKRHGLDLEVIRR
ncbi:uncharacterized protein FFB20_07584 [Fusarium fujikuroi]|uniref:F-box domain-containing protein n=1 Tax=Gibberella fujikuroi (strain CBS 195.34 / IMI 58289 / NRRL A-6831) TaxID=1279085 RepID=S0DZ81_GIBF5|nr:uncharacterized protein FFUJ_14608 [Fusarium fujikuroi IMI 58289]SCN86236.1 uncharacterized protein FFB20_07584 [Fusarium fujikuroi]CCT67856.1 uncharacterized protein FFUJ_14608 [Fusarium fujikuroi IMI 58289]SCN93785.1 uncharacterized protein FFE2_07855 [Fusarium fujikuroi]SCO21730.1 uncharacterized protein FFM5_12741 [Fusarium fujikuroi]SCO41693.1 uncharacterized protein FFNC_08090 [Fusarium fujikuroi]